MSNFLSRREMLAGTTLAAVSSGCFSLVSQTARAAVGSLSPDLPKPDYVLNAGTLIGFNLPIEEEIEIAAKAGYQGIEIWISKINQFLEKGGRLDDLKKQCEDRRLPVVNAISFVDWIGDDDAKRAQGVEQLKQEMGQLAELGCPHIAAPPAGAYGKRIDDLEVCGERYRTILELGDSLGVVPLLEIWGTSATLSRLSDAVAVAVAAGHPKASLLLDVYHLFRGGNRFESLSQISGKSLKVFHINDYPAEPAREKMTDGDRVFPGDGVAPIRSIVRTLRENGFCRSLSLELFNKSYWESGDPISVAKTGLEKMKAAIE